MKRVEKWLQAEGYDYQHVKMTNGSNGIMVNTNYDGQYPPRDIHKMHNRIAKKCNKLKGIMVEPRGFYTALLITAN